MPFTELGIVREEVEEFSPFITDMPVAGNHLMIYDGLQTAYKMVGKMFAGSVEEFVQIGIRDGLREADLRQGFQALAEYGYIDIEDGVFTPTEKFVDQAIF